MKNLIIYGLFCALFLGACSNKPATKIISEFDQYGATIELVGEEPTEDGSYAQYLLKVTEENRALFNQLKGLQESKVSLIIEGQKYPCAFVHSVNNQGLLPFNNMLLSFDKNLVESNDQKTLEINMSNNEKIQLGPFV